MKEKETICFLWINFLTLECVNDKINIIGGNYMILLLKKYGWAEIHIGDNGSIFKGQVSYLRDTPMELLENFKLYVDSGIIPAIKCDEEGSEFLIVIDEYNTHIISERKDFEYCNWEISCNDFVLQVVEDIENQLDDAVAFMCDDENYKERRQIMLSLIHYIKEKLEK